MRAYPLAWLGMAWLALGLGCIDVSTIPAPEGGPPALQWRQQTSPPQPSARSGHAMATLGDKVVLFGGSLPGDQLDGETWAWDGRTWTQSTPGSPASPSPADGAMGGAGRAAEAGTPVPLVASPSPRAGHAMATRGNKVVLFGGSSAPMAVPPTVLADTWEWDGGGWLRVVEEARDLVPGGVVPVSPPPRSEHAMATLGNDVILFGGEGADGRPLDDTWKWDGASWIKLMPIGGGPPARSKHAMATLGNKVVLFGGLDESGQALADTWEWDGSVWTQKTVPSPSARSGHAMATLSDTVILLGGDVVSGTDSYLMWQWDGTTWTLLQESGSENPLTDRRSRFAMASLNGTVLLFGGWRTFDEGGSFAASDTWEWNGDFWLPRGASPGGGAMAELGGKVVVLENAFTWEWDGAMWTALHPSTSPPGGGFADAMATLGNKIVLYRGWLGSSDASNTWEWDGTDWTERKPKVSPPALWAPAMAALGDKVVLFGGSSGPPRGDTWEWDGTAWTERKPKVSPPARQGHAMATLGDKVVLFGGQDASGQALGDTWEWDGATWTQLSSASAPRARTGHAMATMNESVVLFGGYSGDTSLDDTWALIRGRWTQPPLLTTHPAALWDHAMASVGGEVVLVAAGETWLLDAPAPPVCGNAALELDEQCDDGNDDTTDDCTDSCTLPRCGDGIVQPGFGEECDDGNADETDGCATDCLYRDGMGEIGGAGGKVGTSGPAGGRAGGGGVSAPPPAGGGGAVAGAGGGGAGGGPVGGGGAGGTGGAPPLAGRSG